MYNETKNVIFNKFYHITFFILPECRKSIFNNNKFHLIELHITNQLKEDIEFLKDIDI